MNCIHCKKLIPEGRLKAKPGVKTCVSCSEEVAVGGFQIIAGKTSYCELQVLQPDLALKMRKLQNRKSYNANLGLNHYVTVNKLDNREPKD